MIPAFALLFGLACGFVVGRWRGLIEGRGRAVYWMLHEEKRQRAALSALFIRMEDKYADRTDV